MMGRIVARVYVRGARAGEVQKIGEPPPDGLYGIFGPLDPDMSTDHLALVDARYLAHLRELERGAIERGETTATAWEAT